MLKSKLLSKRGFIEKDDAYNFEGSREPSRSYYDKVYESDSKDKTDKAGLRDKPDYGLKDTKEVSDMSLRMSSVEKTTADTVERSKKWIVTLADGSQKTYTFPTTIGISEARKAITEALVKDGILKAVGNRLFKIENFYNKSRSDNQVVVEPVYRVIHNSDGSTDIIKQVGSSVVESLHFDPDEFEEIAPKLDQLSRKKSSRSTTSLIKDVLGYAEYRKFTTPDERFSQRKYEHLWSDFSNLINSQVDAGKKALALKAMKSWEDGDYASTVFILKKFL